jgi:hypothetical protein
MSKFKVGDKVRCITWADAPLHPLAIYTVVEAGGDYLDVENKAKRRFYGWEKPRFELVNAPAPAIPGRFVVVSEENVGRLHPKAHALTSAGSNLFTTKAQAVEVAKSRAFSRKEPYVVLQVVAEVAVEVIPEIVNVTVKEI